MKSCINKLRKLGIVSGILGCLSIGLAQAKPFDPSEGAVQPSREYIVKTKLQDLRAMRKSKAPHLNSIRDTVEMKTLGEWLAQEERGLVFELKNILTKKRSGLWKEKAAVSTEISNVSDQVSSLTESLVSATESDNGVSGGAIQSLSERLSRMRQKMDQLLLELAEIEDELDSTSADLEEVEDQYRDLNNEIPQPARYNLAMGI